MHSSFQASLHETGPGIEDKRSAPSRKRHPLTKARQSKMGVVLPRQMDMLPGRKPR
jgi:hypothetical protein